MNGMRNVIIMGQRPAGYTAAVHPAQARLDPLVFEGSVTGGGALMRQPRWRTSRVFRRGQLDTDPEGYMLVHPPSIRTTLAGVLA